MAQKHQAPPSFVAGRKGQVSVVDSLVAVLWKRPRHGGAGWPKLIFSELQELVSARQGYAVGPSTIRSSIYKHPELFDRVAPDDSHALRWTLSAPARQAESVS